MRTLLLAIPALLALGGTSFAQQAPGQQPPAPPQAAPMMQNDMPPPPPGRPPHSGPRDTLFAPPPPPSKAAHFRLQKGDMTVDVKCADDEPMVTCADITLQLLNKVAQTQQAPAR